MYHITVKLFVFDFYFLIVGYVYCLITGHQELNTTHILTLKHIQDLLIEISLQNHLGIKKYILGHIGDSRTYRLRDGVLEQLTEDHTFVQQQLQEGLISEDEIRNHPMRHVIFRAVGIKEEMTIDLLKGKTHPADLFLLCSDGLSDMLEDEQIHDILCADTDIERKSENLIESAKAAGGLDNISVVLVAIP